MTAAYDPLRHRDLEQIALVCLRCASTLMQCGARGRAVHECGAMLARAQGVELLGLRVGYASIAITLGSGGNTITRMVTVTHHGVNHRLDQAVRALVHEAVTTGLPAAEIGTRLDALVKGTPRHPAWMVAGAVGLACTAFGELLGADGRAFPPVLLASTLGQYVRHRMVAGGTNVFVVAATTALLTAALAGLGARLAGSATVDLAMFAAALLLVPGVPATSAQADVMDGYPTLGSARAVTVLMTMLFVAIGLWLARLVHGMAL